MSKGKVKEIPKAPVELLCTITKQGNRVMSNWQGKIPQAAKVQVFNNLAFAEHEILVRHKYFTQTNLVDPHTQKKMLIPKENGAPN